MVVYWMLYRCDQRTGSVPVRAARILQVDPDIIGRVLNKRKRLDRYLRRRRRFLPTAIRSFEHAGSCSAEMPCASVTCGWYSNGSSKYSPPLFMRLVQFEKFFASSSNLAEHNRGLLKHPNSRHIEFEGGERRETRPGSRQRRLRIDTWIGRGGRIRRAIARRSRPPNPAAVWS